MNPLRLLPPLAALLALGATAAALDSAGWEFRQEITVEQSGPLRLTLPADTLDAAREDLADLRLLGPDGAEIPFAIIRRNTVRPTTERIPLQARLEGNRTVVEFGLAKAQPIRRLVLECPAPEFTKAASVEIEAGDGQWRPALDSALVFRLRGGLDQLALDLRGTPARSLRVTFDDTRSQPVPITAVVVETGASDPDTWIELPVPVVGTETEARATRLVLDLGGRHRHLAELEFDARERTFQRAVRLLALTAEDDEVVEQQLAAGTIGRLELSATQRGSHLRLPVDGISPTARLELVVENGDSPPLNDVSVMARLRRIDLGFDAPATGRYTLLSGSAEATAPRYDVAAFGADWGHLRPVDAPAAPRRQNPAYRPGQAPADIPELAGPIDPTKWTLRRTLELEAPGAQILELDPAALAGSRHDLGDLRIVRGERQVPYLLERTARVRKLPVALVALPDRDRPNVGRWQIELPVARMPVNGLQLTIDEAPLSRNVVVGELRTDSRGQPVQKTLGYARIERRSADDPATFAIELQTRPESATLIVEIDHGDNAAFAPTRAEVLHPVRRLRFRATDTTGLALLHGNPTATAPRYDLQLAAPRLLAATPHMAKLEAVTTRAVGRAFFGFGGTAVRVAFWAALAVVVALLVLVVARLLPKPPEAP